jgi:Voltage gated chloride channel
MGTPLAQGWLVPIAPGVVGAAVARILVVRFAPQAEGSGIQRVEAVFSGDVQPAPNSIVPVKFFGGLLAMGSGLALGREGPTVQMGATLTRLISRPLKDDQDMRVIGAAGAGAGLAVAFNAPTGGTSSYSRRDSGGNCLGDRSRKFHLRRKACRKMEGEPRSEVKLPNPLLELLQSSVPRRRRGMQWLVFRNDWMNLRNHLNPGLRHTTHRAKPSKPCIARQPSSRPQELKGER